MENKVILDEMQQKTLLEIEHKTLHIALTGLLIVILIQQIFWKDGQNTLGESAVLLISSGYLLLSYIKNGIWDRSKPFSAKTNRVISLLVSLAMGIFLGVTNQLRYHDPLSSVLTFVISFLSMLVLLSVFFAVIGKLYLHRVKQLDEQADMVEVAHPRRCRRLLSNTAPRRAPRLGGSSRFAFPYFVLSARYSFQMNCSTQSTSSSRTAVAACLASCGACGTT